MLTSEVLNKAADLIEERGWVHGLEGLAVGDGPKCADGALAVVTHRRRQRAAPRLYDYGHICGCPASAALAEYVGFDRVWLWNDELGRTAAEVIEVLRATALIEAAKENADTRQAVSA